MYVSLKSKNLTIYYYIDRIKIPQKVVLEGKESADIVIFAKPFLWHKKRID